MRNAIVAGLGALGVATWAGFQCYWPTSQVWGKTFIGLDPGSRAMALTFDDGPNDPWTLRMLDVLQRHEVKATFFVLGKFVAKRTEIARAIVAAGHELGVHSWNHRNFLFVSAREVRRQIERTQQTIFDATGYSATLMRPPYGARRPATLRTIREFGLEPVMWNVPSYDWRPISTERIVAHVDRQVRGGDIILFHDGEHTDRPVDRSRSVEATARVIQKYKDTGRQFLTVSEMLAARAEQ